MKLLSRCVDTTTINMIIASLASDGSVLINAGMGGGGSKNNVGQKINSQNI